MPRKRRPRDTFVAFFISQLAANPRALLFVGIALGLLLGAFLLPEL